MNNLERKLIELTFPTVDVEALMEVITATPNPRVATEILCGVYTDPVVCKDKISREGTARTFVSYDKWLDQINYSYMQEKTVYEYFPNSVDRNTITLDNYKSLKCEYGNDTYRFAIKTGELELRGDWTSVADWNRMQDNKFELSDKEIEAIVL
jgi:hypothetical protein